MHTQSRFVVSVLWLCLTPVSVVAQANKTATASTPHPAPQISGRLIGTSGSSQLILEYKASTGIGTFIGNVQSACTIPAPSNSAAAASLQLSQIRKGSRLTLFYVRHRLKSRIDKRTENVILAIRFDQPARTVGIAKGQIISCYKAAQVALK